MQFGNPPPSQPDSAKKRIYRAVKVSLRSRAYVTIDRNDDSRGRMVFQLVQIELNDNDQVVAETGTLPLFELYEHAMAMAEFAAARCHGDYGYDPEHDCWWAASGAKTLRFVVRAVGELDAAA